jgi:nitrogen regulatory protein P-II
MTKKIEAIIRQEKLNTVIKELSNIGIVGLTVLDVRGRGRGSGIQLRWRTGTYNVDLLPRVQINIVLSDDNVQATVDAIQRAAHTGEKGDG